MLGPTAVYTAAILRTKGGAAVRAAVAPATIVAGIATFVAYALVLAALQRASAASVSAVRETSVVIATLLAVRCCTSECRRHGSPVPFSSRAGSRCSRSPRLSL